MALYQFSTGDRITADRLNRTYNLLKGVIGGTDAITLISGTTIDLSGMSATAGLKLPTASGAVPTVAGILAYDSAANSVVWGNGTTTKTPLTDPMTTRGDIVVRGAAGTTRLALGTSGQALKSDGTDVVWGAVSLVLNAVTAATTIANTVVETTAYTFSVPGGTLGTTGALKLLIQADYLNNSGVNATPTIRAKFGATTLGSTAVVWATSANRRAVFIEVDLMALGATNAQTGTLRTTIGEAGTAGAPGSAAAVAGQGVIISMHNAVAEDSTLAKSLVVTVQHDAASVNVSFILRSALLLKFS